MDTLGDLVTCSGNQFTVKVAVLLATPSGVCVVVIPLVAFVYAPAVVLLTVMVMVQLPGTRLGTVRFRLVAPATSAGELVTPTQVPPMVAGAATLNPVRVSVKLAVVRVLPLGFVRVNVMLDVV